MDLTSSEIDGITNVALAGRLDTEGVGAVELAFTATIVPARLPAVIDLGAVSFIGSLGVRLIIGTARALATKGNKLALYGAGEAVAEIIETTGLDELVPVVATQAEALAAVGG